jgi:hypothetical protein
MEEKLKFIAPAMGISNPIFNRLILQRTSGNSAITALVGKPKETTGDLLDIFIFWSTNAPSSRRTSRNSAS